MEKRTIYITLLMGLISISTQAQVIEAEITPIVASANYLSGRSWCDKTGARIKEKGQFLQVPIDYKDLSKGKTEIYFSIVGGAYDPSKKSFFFLTGGPGDTTHRFSSLLGSDWNEIRYDYRGAGCSRPDSYATYLNPTFHSFKNFAQDIESIRQYLQIDQISFYSVSGGTPASSIYSFLYPSRVRALVHEGSVMFPGSLDSGVQWHLQKTYDLFDQKMQQSISKLSEHQQAWLFLAIIMDSSANLGELASQKFATTFFDQSFVLNSQKLEDLIKNFHQDSDPYNLDFDNMVFRAIDCQELEASFYRSVSYRISNKKIEYYQVPSAEKKYCTDIGVTVDMQKSFRSSDYSSTVPIVYFQGEYDYLTPTVNVIQDYRKRQSQKQFIMRRLGSHNSFTIPILTEKNPTALEQLRRVLSDALSGLEIEQDQLDRLQLGFQIIK